MCSDQNSIVNKVEGTANAPFISEIKNKSPTFFDIWLFTDHQVLSTIDELISGTVGQKAVSLLLPNLHIGH